MITTLNKIREHSPCEEGWVKLLKSLNKTKADDVPVSILHILNSNGLDDALWCLRAVDGHDREIRLFMVWCARQVEHLNIDPRVKNCNDVAEKFANGESTSEELDAARDAARDDAWDAANYAARDAASYAARDAAMAAMAARDAAMAAMAARDAASYAARDDAWDAARDDARDAQEKELRRVLIELENKQ